MKKQGINQGMTRVLEQIVKSLAASYYVEYCIKFLISFGLDFLDVKGKIFSWSRRQEIYLVPKTIILFDIEGKVFIIVEVMSIPCPLRNTFGAL